MQYNDLQNLVNHFRDYDGNLCGGAFYHKILTGHYLNEGDIVYDIGSGGGEFWPLFSYIVGASGKVIGIDIWPEKVADTYHMIDDHNLKNTHVTIGDGRLLPLKYGANKFLIIEVLKYLDKENSSKILDEATNACSSNGALFLGVDAKEYRLASAKYRKIDADIKLLEKGTLQITENVFGSVFSKQDIIEELDCRGFSACIESISRSEAHPHNDYNEPESVRNLPSKYFVVAKRKTF